MSAVSVMSSVLLLEAVRDCCIESKWLEQWAGSGSKFAQNRAANWRQR